MSICRDGCNGTSIDIQRLVLKNDSFSDVDEIKSFINRQIVAKTK